MSKIILRAVGDNLISAPIYGSAKQPDGTYDFRGQYDEVKSLIREADIAIVDQETILVTDRDQISDFPEFGTPFEAADALIDAGFNVVMQGTNHALDKGYEGIVGDIQIWKKYADRVKLIGIYDSAEAAAEIPVLEKNGIKVALLNYTQSLNGHPKPAGKEYCVNTMEEADKEKIRADIQKAKALADVVVILPHWGVEYLFEPVEDTVTWAEFFAESGADLILGTHPHVLQYQETITTSDGRKVPCLYSLGNFLSFHMNVQGIVLGGMADIEIVKDETGRVEITRHNIIPTVSHMDVQRRSFKVYPLKDYTDEIAYQNLLLAMIYERLQDKEDVARLNTIFDDIMERKAKAYSIFQTPEDVENFYRTEAVNLKENGN